MSFSSDISKPSSMMSGVFTALPVELLNSATLMGRLELPRMLI